MADTDNKNKRAIIGLIIFAVLILLNIVNYSRRANKQNVKKTVNGAATTQLNKPISNSNLANSGNKKTIAANINSLNPADINVKEQFELTKKILSDLEKKLEEIPLPESEPDFPSALMLSRKKLFQWDSETNAPEQKVATETGIIVEAVASDSYEIIGNFTVKGKKKIWVKKGSKVYVMNGEGTPSKDKLFLLSYAGNDFRIIDEAGGNRDLTFVNKDQERIAKIVDYLKTGNDQTIYEITAEEDDDTKKGEK